MAWFSRWIGIAMGSSDPRAAFTHAVVAAPKARGIHPVTYAADCFEVQFPDHKLGLENPFRAWLNRPPATQAPKVPWQALKQFVEQPA